jgi:hypothetical protein
MAYYQFFREASEATEEALVQSFAQFDKEGLAYLVDLGDGFVNAARASNSSLDVSALSDALEYLRRLTEALPTVEAPYKVPKALQSPVPGAVALSELFAKKLDEIRSSRGAPI